MSTNPRGQGRRAVPVPRSGAARYRQDVLAVTLLCLGVAGLAQSSVAAEGAGGKGAGQPAVEHARVITEIELQQELKQHRGRPVVLHFWATWCGPCMRELPVLARLAEEAQRRGIDFIAVSLDSPSAHSAERVSTVLAQRVRDPHWSSILKIADVDAFMTSIDPGWQGAIPVFFAFDRDTRLRRSHLGDITRPEFEDLIAGLVPAAASGR
ncbi:MAG: redoxin domain-containing protein [Polyangia bacterium]